MARAATKTSKRIESFEFKPGRVLCRKYEIVSKLGSGWESEVYMVKELGTGIERAAKFFFPHRNNVERTVRFHARKLHKLRNCSILIKYYTQERMVFRGEQITFLVSEYVEGEPLNEFIARQRGKRLSDFQGLHLLHALALGMESVHDLREYHGDLHSENIIVHRHGLGFDLKLMDLYQWGPSRKVNLEDDVFDLIKIFYDAIGGRKHYANQRPEVKAICRGLKRTLILENFSTAGELRRYLERMDWD